MERSYSDESRAEDRRAGSPLAAAEHRQQARTAGEQAPRDNAEKLARRRDRERAHEERVAARARNLGLDAAFTRWQPKLDTNSVKLLGSLVLHHWGDRRDGDDDEHGSPRRM
jgi:hypothetical protein